MLRLSWFVSSRRSLGSIRWHRLNNSLKMCVSQIFTGVCRRGGNNVNPSASQCRIPSAVMLCTKSPLLPYHRSYLRDEQFWRRKMCFINWPAKLRQGTEEKTLLLLVFSCHNKSTRIDLARIALLRPSLYNIISRMAHLDSTYKCIRFIDFALTVSHKTCRCDFQGYWFLSTLVELIPIYLVFRSAS